MKHTSKRAVTVYKTGPLGVALINLGSAPYTSHHGDRIAPEVIAPVVQAGFQMVAMLDETERGTADFGSTGRA